MAISHVFVVQHVHTYPDKTENVKLIGVYSDQLRARRAVRELRRAPGFVASPKGFHIDRYEIDKTCWTEGFATL